jgi:WD40 repeat protein
MTRREGYFVLAWDVSSGKEVRRFAGLVDKITSAAFAPGGKVLAAASADGRVCLWDAQTGKERLFILAHPKHVKAAFRASPAVAFGADAGTLVSASTDGTVRVQDATTGKERSQYRAAGSAFSSLAVGRDGKTVVTGSSDGTVLIWDVTTPIPPQRGGRHVITLR